MPKESVLEFRVIKSILETVSTQDVSVGQRFPNEREQSRQLGVSRDTVRRGLSWLEKYGIIERRQGSGTYLKKRVENPEIIIQNIIRDEKRKNEGGVGKENDNSIYFQNVFVSESASVSNTYKIGYLSDNLSASDKVSREIMDGVCISAYEAGHHVFIGSSRPGKEAVVYNEFSKMVYAGDCDGMIIGATIRSHDLKNLSRIPVPYILIAGASSVITDNSLMLDSPLALRRAVSQLVSDGHKKILVVEPGQRHQTPSFQFLCDQLKKEMGLPDLTFLYLCGDDFTKEIDLARFAYTGVFFADSRFAKKCIASLASYGKKLGKDYEAITISYSNIDNDLPGELGRVEFDLFEFGHQALRSLLVRITKKNIILPPMRIGPKFIEPLKVEI